MYYLFKLLCVICKVKIKKKAKKKHTSYLCLSQRNIKGEIQLKIIA